MTSVLCLHYDPCGESQWCVDAPHTKHTCARGSTKILYSAHQKSHEDPFLLMCIHTELNCTQPTCVDNRKEGRLFSPCRQSLEELFICSTYLYLCESHHISLHWRICEHVCMGFIFRTDISDTHCHLTMILQSVQMVGLTVFYLMWFSNYNCNLVESLLIIHYLSNSINLLKWTWDFTQRLTLKIKIVWTRKNLIAG